LRRRSCRTLELFSVGSVVMPNRYQPPSANVADIEPNAGSSVYAVALVSTVRLAVLVVAFYFALSFYYHDAISEFIGRHAPRFVSPFIFPGLIAEAFLIEASVCLPLVYPLAFLYGRFTLPVSLLLAAPVVIRATWEAPYAIKPPLGPALLAFHGLCHFAFLVVASKIVALRLQRSNRSIERTFQRPLRALWPAAHVER